MLVNEIPRESERISDPYVSLTPQDVLPPAVTSTT
jgi:hypothetical protein